MKVGCQIGICEAKDAADAIAKVGKIGFAGIELFDWDLATFREKPRDLKGLLESAGIALAGAYFSSDKFIDPAGEKEVAEKAEWVCDTLAKVGAGFLVLNGGIGRAEGQVFSGPDFTQLARAMNRCGEIARAKGLQAVMHPHFKCMIETSEDVDLLIDAGLKKDLVGLCVHAGHQLVKGVDPYLMYEKHGGWVRYAHISDHTADHKGAFIGEGVLDQKRLMAPLLKGGFDGWIVIESRKEGVAMAEYCARAREYLKKTFPQVKWQ